MPSDNIEGSESHQIAKAGIDRHVGSRLSELRLAAGFTVGLLADKIELEVEALTAMEAGLRRVPAQTL